MMTTLLIAVGLALLVGGGEALVWSASRVAQQARLPPAVIGTLVVGVGTSLPELVVSLSAAIHDRPGIAVSNVVGSNIYNIGLILGLCALLRPLRAGSSAPRDIGVVLGATVALLALGADGVLSRLDGSVLVLAYAAYAWRLIREVGPEGGEMPPSQPAWQLAAALVLGLALLLAGGQLVVTQAVELATSWGISTRVTGLTLVAIGTSLPEMTTSLIATFRGQDDVAIGNVLGSNTFNLLGILGLAALVAPLQVPSGSIRVDAPVALALILVLGFLVARGPLTRLGGAFLLVASVAYTAGLIASP